MEAFIGNLELGFTMALSLQNIALCFGADGQLYRTGGAGHPIFNRIFDQRLQDQCWDMLAHQGAWNVDFNAEPFGITHAFNFEI